jgi:ABC-type branched-subunit amino acid transport system substrate-binding protein
MRSLLLARRRALTACACAAVGAAGLAGCTGTAANSNGSSVPGHTLTIYVSVPRAATSEQNDVVLAEQLALHELRGQVPGFTVVLKRVHQSKLSENARSAIVDPSTIAYLGELQPGTSGQSLGITNAQDVLQVSPTDTAVELTKSTAAVPNSPDKYYESLSSNGRTFARVVPTDDDEAKALVGEIESLGVRHLYVASDGSDYGKALRSAVVSAARSAITLVSAPAGADGVLYAGNSMRGAVQSFNQAASGSTSVKLFASSALAYDAFATALSAAAQHSLYVSSPGFVAKDMPPQSSQFAAAFKAAYGHGPAPQAVFGYQAMALVLASLRHAGGSANSRGTVVHDSFGISNRNVGWPNSALGTYSIDKNGDITFAGGAPFVLERVKAGKLEAVQNLG